MGLPFIIIETDEIRFESNESYPKAVDEQREKIFMARTKYLLQKDSSALDYDSKGDIRPMTHGYNPNQDRLGYLISAIIEGGMNYSPDGGYKSKMGSNGADRYRWPKGNPKLEFYADEIIRVQGTETELSALKVIALKVQGKVKQESSLSRLDSISKQKEKSSGRNIVEKKDITEYLNYCKGDKLGWIVCNLVLTGEHEGDYGSYDLPNPGHWLTSIRDSVEENIKLALLKRGWKAAPMISIIS